MTLHPSSPNRQLLTAAVLISLATIAPSTGAAQSLHIDGNATETAAAGPTTLGTLVAGFNSGTVSGTPGGTYIVPAGANVTLSGLFAGFAPNSSGLITVNGGNITTTNPESQYYIGFNGSGTLVVSNGGSVFSLSQTYVGYNAGSSGVLTVDGQGSTYTNTGFFIVGNGGTGQLNVTNGGVVSSPGGTLQIGGSSTATALVSGAGSLLSAGTFLGVGVGGTGVLTITDGGAATSGSGTYLAFNSGSAGTIVVSNGGSLTSPLLVVGSRGPGDLQIQSDGTVTISGKTIVGTHTGTSSLEVSGTGATLTVQNNDLIVGGQGNGVMTISGQGSATVTGSGGTFIAGQCGAGLTSFCATPIQGGAGTVTVTDPGSVLNAGTVLAVGQFGPGTLTIANGGQVTASSVVIAQNAGSTGTLNIGAAAGAAPAAPGTLDTGSVAFGAGTGNLVFNHTDDSGNYVFSPEITGLGAVNVYSGETVMTGASTYTGPTTIAGGTLAAGAANVFSANSDYTVESGATMDLRGFDQHVASVVNAGLIRVSGDPGTMAIADNYVGQNGIIAIDTFLAGDNAPSDKLILDGGTATGTTSLAITNAGGPGALTLANGIPVVETINGGTTDQEKFKLTGEVRGGAYDYFLFRSGVAGSEPEDWFLRSDFVVGPAPEEPPAFEGDTFPLDPPPSVLPPGTYPIIGPELATYAVVQPLARQLGLATLGTLDQRIGDTLTAIEVQSIEAQSTEAQPIQANDEGQGWTNSSWGRVIGEQINNRYQSFADPSVSGRLLGFQAGLDIWRGSLIPGHRDVAGVYFAYANAATDVDGLVTNAAATGYVHSRTGTASLQAYSGGAYWVHYGPTDWYLDAILQGTHYTGTARTAFASLPTRGNGFIASLEGGYPIKLPLGPHFELEPQAQIIWQNLSLGNAFDGLGPVALGTTDGLTGRLGARGQWTILNPDGQVWQPYGRVNLWQTWDGNATTKFGIDQVPLRQSATQLELAAGITGKLNPRLSIYGQFGYEFAIANSYGRRQGVLGDAGLRYTW